MRFDCQLCLPTREKYQSKFSCKLHLPQTKLRRDRLKLFLLHVKKRRHQESAPIWEHPMFPSWFFSNSHFPVAMIKIVLEWLLQFNCIHSFIIISNLHIFIQTLFDLHTIFYFYFFAWYCGIWRRRMWIFMTLFAFLWEHMIVISANKLAWRKGISIKIFYEDPQP